MSNRKLLIGGALCCALAGLIIAGCSHCERVSMAAPANETVASPERHSQAVAELLPPNAKPGECYVKVFVPEKFETVKETVCVREASERLEVVPARYEWVEEKVLVKDAGTVLEEVPAEFRVEERTVLNEPAHEGWHVAKAPSTVQDPAIQANQDMYCLVAHKPRYETVKAQVLAKPATTRAVTIPAEYQTVRRQKLVAPATTQRITIPAEYTSVDKFQKVANSRVEWRLVDCQAEGMNHNVAVIKDSVARAGN